LSSHNGAIALAVEAKALPEKPEIVADVFPNNSKPLEEAAKTV
jgi:hypothetical protein